MRSNIFFMLAVSCLLFMVHKSVAEDTLSKQVLVPVMSLLLKDTEVNCDDGNTCTSDTYDTSSNTCINTIVAGNCLIDGACYADGETNPSNVCQICDIQTSQEAWSNNTAGSPCDALPNKFIAATVFTSGSYSTPAERLAFTTRVAEASKTAGIDAVNLVVDWGDLEPTQGLLEFDLLEEMIGAIRSRQLYCILRIYANVEGHWQVWPAWLAPFLDVSDTYTPTSRTYNEIFPWVANYQTAWGSFLANLTTQFSESNINQPDAVQITVGGSFGEQVLSRYDSEASGWVWPAFNDTLFAAEKQHVDLYADSFMRIAKSHILMVNSLESSRPDYEDQVAIYAAGKGVDWVQSNAGACSLKADEWGPDNARMIARAHERGRKIFLEDESGGKPDVNAPCQRLSLSNTLSSRVDYMIELQDTYGFQFSAVSIDEVDLSDQQGLVDLKNMLGI